MTSRVLRRLRTSLGAVAAAFDNPDMRRLQIAWAGTSFALWSFAIALGVYAFEVSGATAVGIAALVRLLPGAIASPFAGLVGDRYSRKSVLLASTAVGGIVLATAAALTAADAPPGVVFALAGLFMVVTSPYVPAEGALLPLVARTPQELSAANVAHSAMDNAGFLAGSLAAGGLLAATSPELVFAVAAATTGVTLFLVARVGRDERPDYASEIDLSSALRHTALGMRALAEDDGLRLLAAALTLLAFFEGAADVLVVIVALDLLELGSGSVGYLNAAWGIGALAGGAVLAVLLDRGQLAAGLAMGSLVVGVATALPAAWAVPAMAFLAWLGIGLGYTFVEVAARTLMQRLSSDETMSRILALTETGHLGAAAVGSIVAPAAVALFGIRGAVLALAVLLPAFAVVRWAALRRFESGAPVAERQYSLLRANPIFEPLPVATLERLSHDAVARDVVAGEEIITQGGPGERFFVIDEGEVEVFEDGVLRRTEGAGESFGEIALLRDVPRTATVRAVRPTRLWTLEREQFIVAVTGHARSHEAGHAVADARLPTS